MRRPVVEITEDKRNDVYFMTIKLPVQIIEALNEENEPITTEEIPMVTVIPHPTHVIVQFDTALKPRFKTKPYPGRKDLFAILFWEVDWQMFWEKVDHEIRMAKSPEEKWGLFWKGNEARLPPWHDYARMIPEYPYR